MATNNEGLRAADFSWWFDVNLVLIFVFEDTIHQLKTEIPLWIDSHPWCRFRAGDPFDGLGIMGMAFGFADIGFRAGDPFDGLGKTGVETIRLNSITKPENLPSVARLMNLNNRSSHLSSCPRLAQTVLRH